MTRPLWLLYSAALLLATAGHAQSSDPPVEALNRARTAGKPLLLFHRAACVASEECSRFDALLAHSAVQRRLRQFEVATVPATADIANGKSHVSIHDPSGELAMRWFGLPSQKELLQILWLADRAVPHLIASASSNTDASDLLRERALSRLALGDTDRGAEMLRRLRESGEEEDRQLASVWLHRIEARLAKRPMDTAFLDRSLREARSQRVRLEVAATLAQAYTEASRPADAARALRIAVSAAPSGSSERAAALQAMRRAEDDAVGIVGLGHSGSIVSGRRTLRPRITATGVATVEYRLDGRVVTKTRRAPFIGVVQFGSNPARHLLEIVARARGGEILQSWSTVVNERSDAFGIRITEPVGNDLKGEIDVRASIQLPRGRSLESVVIEWNGTSLSRSVLPPYQARFTANGEQGILRAVLTLDDGSETEDVRLINSSTGVAESRVHLVEVPVYLGGGESGLLIREGGRRRALERLVPAGEAPLLIGLVLDTSLSMDEHILDVQEAAIRFLEKNLAPGDRAFVIGFDSRARLVAPPTGDRSQLEHAVLSMRAGGATALHDGVITALLQFQTTGVRRALILFSDGLDSSSTFSSKSVAEVAQRSGVPIYVMALRTKEQAAVFPQRRGRNMVLMKSERERIDAAVAHLMRISAESGGRGFEMASAASLPAIYDAIATDLDQQALAIFRPGSSPVEWRSLEVTSAGGKKVRSPAGVFVDEVGEPER